MLKMKTKLRIIALILVLVLLSPIYSFAGEQDIELKYLNIGDSIAYGLSADPRDSTSYFPLYEDYLHENFGFEKPAVNLGNLGIDSTELLKALKKEYSPTDGITYIWQNNLLAQIPEADVITISIGGNNLLTPVIASVFEIYGATTEEEFMGKVVYAGKDIWNLNLNGFVASALSSEYPNLGTFLESGTQQFLSDWPAILDEIEDLNSDAHIIALTLYNPIEKEDNEALYYRFEELLKPMNMAMKKTQNRAKLADVAKSFKKESDAIDFRLKWMDGMPPVWLDPHPTTLGHEIIFNEITKVRNPNSFK
ncbi:hypothetical protein E9840_01260 [Tissierella creatinini]|nr:hypothetical protein E9840_01260 [Tissierella creatinini]TJX64181.1 hypothetical protein E8P77_13090 [Soehngenia saccharolytica]